MSNFPKRVYGRCGHIQWPAQDLKVSVEQLWRIVLARGPRRDEVQMVQDWIGRAKGSPSGDFGVWPQLAQALMSTAEFQYFD